MKKFCLAVGTLLVLLLGLPLQAAASGVAEGSSSPDITVQTFQGGEINLYAFTGAKPVLIWFTNFSRASLSAIPEIAQINSRYREKGLHIIIISLRGQDTDIPSNAGQQYGLSSNIFLDPSGYACQQMAGEYLEGTLPANNFFLLDNRKVVRLVRHFPGIPSSNLESEIEKLL